MTPIGSTSRKHISRRLVLGAAASLAAAPALAQDHFEMNESLGNPYGPNGHAALAMMKLSIG